MSIYMCQDLETIHRSERLIYRALEDTPAIRALFTAMVGDTAAHTNNHCIDVKPFKQARVDGWLEYLGEKALLAVVIYLPDEEGAPGTPIGRVNIGAQDAESVRCRRGNIGIELLRAHQGQGYGSEAIRWIVDWGFRIENFHRLVVQCYTYNVGARQLYQRLGFTLEGTTREDTWFNGRWHGIHTLGLLKREWKRGVTECKKREEEGKKIEEEKEAEKV